jgi:translocator protein
MRDRYRQWANVIAAVLQILSPGWSYATGIGQPIWEQSGAVTTPATPASYAFFIWSFIFLTSLVYAVYQALPAQREDALLRRIGWFSALAFFLNAVWAAIQQTFGSDWWSVAVIFSITAAAFAAFLPVARTANLGTARMAIIAVPLGALAGWIAVASPINVDQALTLSNVAPFGWSATEQSLAVLAGSAGLCAVLLIILRGNPIFLAAPMWALIAIVAASIYRTPNLPVGVAASVGAAALAGLSLWLQTRRSTLTPNGI